MNITILAGGLSPERDVSLSSASLIERALRSNGHKTCLIDLYLGIETLPADLDTLFQTGDTPAYPIPEAAPDLAALKAQANNGNALIGPHVLDACRAADITFLALHGSCGENGQLQATLDTHGIRYTGSGYIGSALAMDKDLSKRIVIGAGVKTAEWIYLPTRDVTPDAVKHTVGFPCVVKPCSCGSSVGVSIVESEAALTEALAAATLYEGNVLIERKVTGREFSVGILGGKALPPIEIIPIAGFYDYKNKYQSGMTRELCPAPLTEEENASLADAALKAFHALRLRGYARIDFILEETTGTFIFLEANTLPGMTPTSLLPQEAAAAGIRYEELCDIIARM